MKIISWNVQGLGKSRTFREAQKLLQELRPQILFLSETKMMAKQMEVKRRLLKFENCFVVDRCGLGGGLALLWTSDVSLEVKSYSKHHIDSVIHNGNGSSWRCTGVYGHPESEQKKHTWSLLRRLAGMSSLPWLCFGILTKFLT
ncbi:hypothetical protein AB3S75_038141 [Citrus x aurantiifolia]